MLGHAVARAVASEVSLDREKSVAQASELVPLVPLSPYSSTWPELALDLQM